MVDRLIVDNSTFHTVYLQGGVGDDFIATEGNDIARGGPGADIFVLRNSGYRASNDPVMPAFPQAPPRIADFVVGEDHIVLPGYSGTDAVADGVIHFEAVSGGTGVVTSGGSVVGVLERVDPTGLTWAQVGMAWSSLQPTVGLGATTEVTEGDYLSLGFTRTSGTDAPLTLYWTISGTGDNPVTAADFDGPMSGTLTIQKGYYSASTMIHVAKDGLNEGDEGYVVTFTGGDGLVRATYNPRGVLIDDTASPHPGQMFVGGGPGSTVSGGTGDDTFQGSGGHDVLTGGRGADVFTWGSVPHDWSSITDFRPGVDRLDFSTLLRQAGYDGDTPVGDGYISLQTQNSGQVISFDADGKGPGAAVPIVRLDSGGSSWAILGGRLPTLDIQAQPISLAEGDTGYTYFDFVVTRSGPADEASSAAWRAIGDGPNAASYGDLAMGNGWQSGYVEFAAGETSKVIRVKVTGDNTIEADETFRVELSSPSSATIGRASASATIINDDHPPPPPQVGFASSTVSLAEGNFGSNGFFINFTVKRTGDTSGSSTVDWRATPSGDHPTDSDDFVNAAMSGTLTFAPGETSKAIGLMVRGDTTAEADETFTVTLSNVTNGSLGATAVSTGIILNDDGASSQPPPSPPPTSSEHVYNSPGPGSTVTAGSGDDTINASQGADVLTGGAGHDTFAWAKAPWSPARVTDFVVGTDRIDLSAIFRDAGYTGADPVADKVIWLMNDGKGGTNILFDKDGAATGQQWPNYIIHLDGVSANGLTWAQLTGAASPTPPPPTPSPTVEFENGTHSNFEGASGATPYTFTVRRSGPTDGSTVVNWSVSGNGADALDFTGAKLPSGTLTFAPGETSKGVIVNVAGDTQVEADEGFTITLTVASGGTLGTYATATATIRNDDSAPTTPPPQDPPPTSGGSGGQVYNSPGPGSTVSGGGGDDTLNASQGADVLTGGAGHDVFAWAKEPWAPAHITDFVVGTDRLDLSKLLQAAGYSGSDPVADKYVWLIDDGAGGTKLLFDRDGAAAGQQWPNYVINLDHVQVSGLTWAQLTGGAATNPPPQSPPPQNPPPQDPPPQNPPPSSGGSGGAGQVITSSTYGDTLSGTAGDDTLNAGQGPDRLTGAGGADHFVFGKAPWNAGHVTDFTPGLDKLDLRGLFSAYSGSDPLADHRLEFRDDGHGNTQVYVDVDAPNSGEWPYLVTTLDHVTPGQLGAGDWIFH